MKVTDMAEDLKILHSKVGLEKHVQTILLSIITASLIMGYQGVRSISDRLIRMEEREMLKRDQLTLLEAKLEQVGKDVGDLRSRLIRVESQQQQTIK